MFKELKLQGPKDVNDYLANSSKLQYLNQILENILKDHKVLIFSQFKGMLGLVGDFLSDKGIGYLMLTGDTPNAERHKLIDSFNLEDNRVFLLSTRAGGLGLNLTQADTVFILDSDYNPHND